MKATKAETDDITLNRKEPLIYLDLLLLQYKVQPTTSNCLFAFSQDQRSLNPLTSSIESFCGVI